jgi:hypothetical protein
LESPLKVAFQLNFPSVGNVCEAEEGTVLLFTVTVDTTVGVPVQSGDENMLYVTVPPAWKPPVNMEELEAEPPLVMGFAERVVEIVSVALLIKSGLHGLVA